MRSGLTGLLLVFAAACGGGEHEVSAFPEEWNQLVQPYVHHVIHENSCTETERFPLIGYSVFANLPSGNPLTVRLFIGSDDEDAFWGSYGSHNIPLEPDEQGRFELDRLIAERLHIRGEHQRVSIVRYVRSGFIGPNGIEAVTSMEVVHCERDRCVFGYEHGCAVRYSTWHGTWDPDEL